MFGRRAAQGLMKALECLGHPRRSLTAYLAGLRMKTALPQLPQVGAAANRLVRRVPGGCRFRRPGVPAPSRSRLGQEGVAQAVPVVILSNDLSRSIDSKREGLRGAREIHGLEVAPGIQESVEDEIGIKIASHSVSPIVDAAHDGVCLAGHLELLNNVVVVSETAKHVGIEEVAGNLPVIVDADSFSKGEAIRYHALIYVSERSIREDKAMDGSGPRVILAHNLAPIIDLEGQCKNGAGRIERAQTAVAQ